MAEDDLSALRGAAQAAWTFCLPLVVLGALRARTRNCNVIFHVKDLLDHRARAVTTPNNDTLYSSAHLDLSHGPVRLTLPRSGDRYVSVALMDAFTNNFAVLGTRTTGGSGGAYVIMGPDGATNGAADCARSPTRHVWVLARTLVCGPADLAAARAVQSGFAISGTPIDAPPAPAVALTSVERWREFFAFARLLLQHNPPPVTDAAVLHRMSLIDVPRFDATRFSAAEAAAIVAGISAAHAEAQRGGLGGTRLVNGWTYPHPRLGDFAQNYALRAAVALNGLGALPLEEAMYMQARGSEPGGLFDGRRSWILHFPIGRLPPVGAFMSLTLYEPAGDGRLFFCANPLGRYSIGDRTQGLVYNRDGSLTIHIGSVGKGGNWLPAPPGPFTLFMRAYLPLPPLLEGDYTLPPVLPAASPRL